jgi:methylenetetrahydrofolate--tRNA-(uracil-5-)-methyltransferase
MSQPEIHVIGGGLAGSEAAWQVAQRGLAVSLYEMRPEQRTPAHQTGWLAELVCSNSLGSNLPDRAMGLLKNELRALDSLIVRVADETAVPAGGALAVGRDAFARAVTERISGHPLIELRREEIKEIPKQGVAIIATGPLTSAEMSVRVAALTGKDQLYFYDAMAPIVSLDSIDMSRVYRASRYGKGDPDYLNCPMTEAQYDAFVDALLGAERIPLRSFEREDKRFFEACLPVEVIAERGHDALAYGPLRPVGLIDPRSGVRPHAVVQLRQDNLAATLYNLVGFQTNLRWSEQARVFRMIPGLEQAEFVRFGQMHRNTYINSPALLDPTMAYRGREGLFFAGQITGTEGYVGSTASGWVAGWNAARMAQGCAPLALPVTTMIGALCQYVSTEQGDFQPMKANFGLLPPLSRRVRSKRARHQQLAERAVQELTQWMRVRDVCPG